MARLEGFEDRCGSGSVQPGEQVGPPRAFAIRLALRVFSCHRCCLNDCSGTDGAEALESPPKPLAANSTRIVPVFPDEGTCFSGFSERRLHGD